jgi:hypothetical protein
VYSLYVTDFTKNEDLGDLTATKWCPSELSKHVLKIEMMDNAASMGPTLGEGSFVALSNVRVMIDSHAGGIKAKMVEVNNNKIRLMTVEEAEVDPHLKALLEYVPFPGFRVYYIEGSITFLAERSSLKPSRFSWLHLSRTNSSETSMKGSIQTVLWR